LELDVTLNDLELRIDRRRALSLRQLSFSLLLLFDWRREQKEEASANLGAKVE